MTTKENLRLQAQILVEAAMRRKNAAQQMLEEAEHDLARAKQRLLEIEEADNG